MPALQGLLVLADISGYTKYMAGTEHEHSIEILRELIETIANSFDGRLRIDQLEGDALCATVERTDPEILGWLHETFGRFHSRLRDIRELSTSPCRACGPWFISHLAWRRCVDMRCECSRSDPCERHGRTDRGLACGRPARYGSGFWRVLLHERAQLTPDHRLIVASSGRWALVRQPPMLPSQAGRTASAVDGRNTLRLWDAEGSQPGEVVAELALA